MSLRNKVVGILLGVFAIYALAAWLVVRLVHEPSFSELERTAASDQLSRVRQLLETERRGVDLLVTDWAMWSYTAHRNEDFYDENLAEGYVGTDLGMSFAVILDAEGGKVWGEAYPKSDATTAPLESVFPNGIGRGDVLRKPTNYENRISGLIETAQGPAIVASLAIQRGNESGPIHGHLIMGKLLDSRKLGDVSRSLLATVDLLPVERSALPEDHLPAFDDIFLRDTSLGHPRKDKFGTSMTHRE